jgi:pimeloyl-ACP methyl ester carboxylesterase
VSRFRPLLAAALAAYLVAPGAHALASSPCEQPPQVTAIAGSSASTRPVVLVHGWDGQASTMQPVANALGAAKLPVHPFLFDYRSHNTDWASRPTVAGCLSAYIAAISAAYQKAGGDGKVIVIAHSMGGLAARFASNSQFTGTPVSQDLGAIITVDTPALGSPFGNQSLARAMQALPVFGGHHPASVLHGTFMDGFQTPPGTDASICLALHQPPANRLPHGCALAPYLPTEVPVTQLAGDINLKRTLFGVTLYKVDFAADGPVSVQSAHSYTVSGLGGHAPLGTDATDQPTLSCTVTFDDVEAAVGGAAVGGLGGALASLPATYLIDNAAVEEQLSGETGKAYDALLYGSYLVAPCSHGGMLTWKPSLQLIVKAVSAYIQKLNSAQKTARVQEAPVDQRSMPRRGLSVTDGGSAEQCAPGSDSAGYVYRCFDTHNHVLDPCWTDASDPRSPAVICQQRPWDSRVTRLTLPQGGPPPFSGAATPIPQNAPWGVQLADGERCIAAQGAHDNALGQVVEYACGSGYAHVLLGLMTVAKGVGSFDSAYYLSSRATYRPGPRETATTAWYAIPDHGSADAAAANTCSGAALAYAAAHYEAAHNDPHGALPDVTAHACAGSWALITFTQDAPPPG